MKRLLDVVIIAILLAMTSVCIDGAPTGSCANTEYNITVCPKFPNWEKYCLNKYFLHLLGDLPCYPDESAPDSVCLVHENKWKTPVAAIDLNGDGWDYDGYAHISDNNITDLYHDPQDIRDVGKDHGDLRINSGLVKDMKAALVENRLFETYVEAKPVPYVNSDTCLSYHIRLQDTGRYWLLMSFIEPTETQPNRRRFTVKFNDHPILENFDIISVAKYPHFTIKVCLLFDVDEGSGTYHRTITTAGVDQHEIPLFNSVATLDLCYGDCSQAKVPNNRFVMSAFQVLRFAFKD